jgi:hypothetical protein
MKCQRKTRIAWQMTCQTFEEASHFCLRAARSVLVCTVAGLVSHLAWPSDALRLPEPDGFILPEEE